MNRSLDDVYHLYSRGGFGCSYKDARTFQRKGNIQKFVAGQKASEIEIGHRDVSITKMKKMTKEERKAFRKQSKLLGIQLNVKWLKQMASAANPLQEKMTLFWHGHFACSVFNAHLMKDLNNIMRVNALGNFRTLITKVAQSGAMINYLHLQQNKKQSPNEDFARELCELFTLGRDTGYAEKDIPEIARAFTGWMTNLNGEFFFNTKRHDYGSKTIFGQTGNFKGEAVIDLILEKKETARFIATKVYRYFVNPVADQKNVNELADVFYQSDYDIKQLMTHLFSSDWFYEEQNKGVKIKSPVELLVGLIKGFNIELDKQMGYVMIQRILEQVLFKPPNVAGWPGDKKWIDSSRLAFRMRLPSVLLTNGVIDLDPPVDLEAAAKEEKKRGLTKRLGASADWGKFFSDNKGGDYEMLLLRSKQSQAASKLLNSKMVESDKEAVLRILSLPEYQLC